MQAIYLDANALIEAVEKEGSTLLRSMTALRSLGYRLVTSELSLAEVLVVPVKINEPELISIYEALLGGTELIEVAPVSRSILRESAAVRARTGQKLPDAIHVATAVLTECGLLISSDKGLRLPDGMKRVAVDDAETIGSGE